MKLSYDRNLAALVLLAFVARFWDAMAAAYFLGDEVIFIPISIRFFKEGQFIYHSPHPPLNHILTYGGIKLFGDNPYGWRMLNIILGSLSVGVIIAIGKRLFSDRRVAYLAGAFFAIEPMHIILSRANFIDIGLIFFFLCGVYGTLRYLEDRRRSLLGVGIAFGLTLAEKWTFLFPIAFIAAYIIFSDRQNRLQVWRECFYVASSFIIIPAAVYLIAYTPWFKMGHSLSELFQLQIDMYIQQQASNIGDYLGQFVRFMPSTSPWIWFAKPLISAVPIVAKETYAQYMVFMNNPPVWLLGFPAGCWSIYIGMRDRNKPLLFTLMLFVVSYGQFALVDRPLFLHTATAVLPFLYLLISFSVVDIIRKLSPSIMPYRAVIFLVIAWGIYLYPFVTGQLVPTNLYAPLLSLGKLH